MITRYELREIKAHWMNDPLGFITRPDGIQPEVLGLIKEIEACWAALERIHQDANNILYDSSRPDTAWVEHSVPQERRE